MSKRWSSIRDVRRILIVFGVIVLTACSKNDGQASAKERPDATTESLPKSEMVDVWLEDEHTRKRIHFRLPRGYLSQWRDVLGRKNPNNSGGEQVQMILETGLPELQPRAYVIVVKDEAKKVGLAKAEEMARNGLLITVERFLPIETYGERTRATFLKDYRRDPSLDVATLGGFSGKSCNDVKEGERETLRCGPLNQDEIYFPTERSNEERNRTVYVSCIRPSVNPYGGCVAHGVYRERAMSFMFRRSEISRWREFEGASFRLLDQFIVE